MKGPAEESSAFESGVEAPNSSAAASVAITAAETGVPARDGLMAAFKHSPACQGISRGQKTLRHDLDGILMCVPRILAPP